MGVRAAPAFTGRQRGQWDSSLCSGPRQPLWGDALQHICARALPGHIALQLGSVASSSQRYFLSPDTFLLPVTVGSVVLAMVPSSPKQQSCSGT